MRLLEERILKDGLVLPGNVLKVDNFLNHQIDVPFIDALCEEWVRLFASEKITKILTIEASGIAIASIAALRFGVPLVFAKKSRTSNIGDDLYAEAAVSYTHGQSYHAVVSKSYLTADDRVLIIDDFLANGSAMNALIGICAQASATVAGIGIMVEKGFQHGGDKLRERGYHLESLAVIESMSPEEGIRFR